jgi:1-deoxy-D-xylulose-5-phosphate reductoisomerase
VVSRAAAIEEPAAARPPRRITILGATGSIGASTLAVIDAARGAFEIEAVTANSNAAKLAQVARSTGARLAAIADPGLYAELKRELAGSGIEAAAGPEAIVEAAGRRVDLLVAAIVGAAGLAPTLAAIRSGTRIALANKECLVCAGDLFMTEARRAGVAILPVDSEHNAIFQILDGRPPDGVERIVLTASGGPFRSRTREEMARATPAEALRHPNWSMGPKVTIDSATLMNKGLELIEAHYLFAAPASSLDVIIHPQSIVHALVAFSDGATLACLSPPDMRTPIAHCLAWPERSHRTTLALDLAKIERLSFEAADYEKFPALRLARTVLESGGAGANIMNAANEIAVASFLEGRIGFLEIARIVEDALDRASAHSHRGVTTIEDAVALDAEGRRLAAEIVNSGRRKGD